MNKKIYIITILAIIVTTLSQTVSIISGEHQFYQNVQDKCIKCHGDIKAQLLTSANHSSDTCNFCHVKSATNHTNTNPACQDCHNTTQKLNDSLEAHTDFSSMGSKGCIACHTTYNTLTNYSRAEYIDYTITNNNGNWVISNITTIGTLNLSYNAQRKGGDHDIQNVSCKDCHEDIFEAVSLGGHAVVLAKNSTNITNGTQVPYHDNSNTTLEEWCRTCHSRNDTNFSTQQHSVRKTTCEECHQAYNLTPHPGNFFTNINTVPHLYRSLVCISCHSIGWPAPSGGIHFKVHQEPYFDVTYEIIVPLLITNSTPAGDPTTTAGTAQTFSITLNRPADIYWYNNGSEIFRALSVISSSYTSNAGIGVYNITATANDGYTTVSRMWNWTVTNQTINGTGGGGGGGISPGGGIVTGSATGTSSSNNISGYVFDNNVLTLPDVLVQSGSYQNTTNISGYYSITNLSNGTYNFSYSKAGFNTGYSVFTLNGASVENVNVIIYDTTPPASVSNISMATGNFYINNSWTNPTDADFNYTWFRYDNGTTLQNINKSTNYLNLTWSPHYTQNISAQTVDNYNNINQALIWFNATVPNNPPVQAPIGNKTVYEGQLLTFTVNATDTDNDTITYGTNSTKGTFNTTTGNFSWVPNYGDSGFYLWDFNSSDGYGGIANENVAVTVIDVPLSITNESPATDPTTIVGSSQTFSITLNRTANVIWYNNGSEAFRVLNVTSASYTNSTADIGTYNITAFANDSYDSALGKWNWTVIPNVNGTNVSGGGDGGGGSGGSNNSVSGYVFDNFGLSLGGVLVQNGSYQNTTDASGYYSIANLPNGTYNFSYSRAGFSTAYFEFTLNGAVVINANRTLYDIMPTTSISNPSMTTGNFYVNNTWVNPVDPDFNYTWFRYSNDITLQNVSKPVNYLNLTWSPHYTQNISAQTVDTSGNVNQTKVWFNTTIPNNAPFQYTIGNKVVNENENLQFNVIATDADNDTITYGTNATKGIFNTTTGNFSWTPAYGDAGFYYWNFNSSDGYGGIANENVAVTVVSVPLSIISSSPAGDPTTIINTTQAFGITLNRTADVTWYINGSVVQSNLSVVSANYTNSTAGIGAYNVTAIANDGYYSASRTWNWTVSPQPTYNVSGYVFDNYGSGLGNVLVKNESSQNTTDASSHYLITGLLNGTYNFSYSKAGFNTGYLGVTINGADNTSANITIYDTTPPASVSNANATAGNFYVNNTWVNPADADFNYTWFRYSNGTTLQNISTPTNYLNLTWSPHYTQNISAQSVDNYSNVNQTMIWFNATIPNNAPVQTSIGNQTVYEGQLLTFTVNATDADNDTITYGTNATKGTFNTTTGNFSWTPNYGDAGFYYWNFNSSDGYGGIANENVAVTVINAPLSIMSSSPTGDTTSMVGLPQTFEITLNRTADIAWYINGSIVQMNSSVISANYTNITAGIGEYNITAVANDSYYSISRTWNWIVIAQPTYNVSGYVFDNYGSGLGGVLVQNGTNQNTTAASGYYLVTGLLNGTYNFSYSKVDFNTGYLGVTINGTDNTNANITLYDTTSPASVSNPNTTTGNFYINNTWINPVDTDFNYTWFKYSNGTNLQNVSSPVSYLNLTWSPHYMQNISAQTVDNYSNINQTLVWFNATIPNNAPFQYAIGNKVVNENENLQFNVTATDADNDTITYGTNATKGTFNTTTGNFSWTPGYGDAGVYVWYFNSSDGYGGVASENVTVTVGSVPLSITSSSPVSDPTTTVGTAQAFGITLNKTADVTWYINGSAVQINSSVVSADYTNFTAGIGEYNVTAIANDSYYSTSRTWNWTVIAQPTYNVSGYVFDNYGSGLGDVLVQNGSYQNTTLASGYYLITGLLNGTYNFSYSKAGFNTGYLGITINGADNTTNTTLYDTTPPASVSNPNTTTDNFYINNTWTNPADADYNYTWFRYSNGTNIQNVSKPTNYLNLTWSPHYTQNISAQTVDNYSNINQTKIWFNTTILDNPPVQAPIGNQTVNEGQWLNFTVSATDVDNDTITYSTNATKGTFNTTTGNFSWLTTYSDAGTYTWYFNSSEGYGGIASETIIVIVNHVPLSITSSSPASDPITTVGTAQTFGVVLNRTANVTWYMNGSIVQSNLSITSVNYANSTAAIGMYNVTAIANDSYDSALRTWNWTVIAQPTYSLSGYVFDNYGSGLDGVQVQNGSKQGTTIPSGYYLITGLFNGTYNFSYSKAGFDTGYLEVTINGVDNTSANKTIYDTTPPAQVTGLANDTPTQTTVNLTWNTTADANYYQVFRDSTSLGYTRNNYWNDTGLTADTLYGYTVRANDSYNNWGQNSSILNVRTAQAADTTPPASVSNPATAAGNFYVNNTWTNPADADYSHAWFKYSNDSTLTNVSNPTNYLNLTWSPHYTQNISAQTVDTLGNVNQTKVWFNVTILNNAPVQSTIGNKAVDEGQLLSFTVSATDADGDSITYGTNATKGTLNTTTGQFSWTPSYGDAGVYIWYFNSSDGYGGVASENITVTVNNVPLSITNSSPASDPTTIIGTPQTFAISLNRTTNVTWYINGSVMQKDLSVVSANYTNSTAGIGTYNVTAAATDGYYSTSKQWDWTVNSQPVYAPSITSWSNSKTNNNSLTLAVNTSETINFNATANQTITTWGWYQDSVNQSNNYDNFTTSWSTAGTKTIQVNATNSNGTSNTITWDITVQAQPVAYIPPPPANINSTTGNFWVNTTWQAGIGNTTDSYNVSVNGTWTNGTTSTYVNSPLPAHAWQNVTVYAYNASGTGSLSVSPATNNTQIPDNPPVQAQIGNKSVTAGNLLTFTVSATDTDNDTITYGTNATKGTLNATTGVYSWQTASSDAGTYIWYFNSSDGYSGVASETITVTVNNTPLSITSSSPVSDPTTTVDAAQAFSIALNRTANVTWYINGSIVQTNSSVISANYTNSTAGVGVYNVTATASDGLDSASRIWNWTVISQPTYNVSGYVFDNYGSGLGGVLVQNGSYQSNTSASGYYSITGLLNGTYNFSYSKAGFNTGYLEVTINGADNTTANTTIYDTTPPANISNTAAASAALYINWTWIDPIDSDFDHVMVYIDGTFMRNITKGVQFYNASYFMPNSTHTISTLTVDTYGNVNTTWVNNTAATLPDYMYVSSFQNDTGTVSDFSNAMNASDGGASATFTEANVSGAYLLNITINTTDIPAAGVQTLQLMYNVSGDNFTLQIWNGSIWNNRTTLNDTSPSYRNITLMPEELIPEGTYYVGYAGSISRYYVLVRYLDLNASAAQQGNLYLDYQRVYSE